MLLRLFGDKKFDLWYKIQAGTVSAITILAAILVSDNSNAGIQELAENFVFALFVLAIVWSVPRGEQKGN